jgi:hypothetical protein
LQGCATMNRSRFTSSSEILLGTARIKGYLS